MDDDTGRAAVRLDRLAERIQVGMAVVAGLLLAVVVWMTFLIILAGHIARGLGSDGPAD